ncbi:MAG: cadherin-like domain-containing protein, partial [Planctomycetales bacterium]|nr:cadherin-like domain-containing protein [Planctomycetales bacterium]
DFGFNFDTIVNTHDSGQGSLRQAIGNAELLDDEDRLAQAGLAAKVEHLINMIPLGNDSLSRQADARATADRATIVLTGGSLQVSTAIAFDGGQPGQLVVSREASAADFRLFDVAVGGDLRLADLTLSGGRDTGGAAIQTAGELSLRNVEVTDSRSLDGHGAILVTATGQATIVDTAIVGNMGSGLYVDSGSVQLIRGTIADNSGDGVTVTGGGITRVDGTLWLRNGELPIDLGNDGVTANDGLVAFGPTSTAPNGGMDYPIFTAADFRAGSLFVSGFVGSQAGQSQFAGSTVQVYLASADGSAEGETVLGDGRVSRHGAGAVLLGTLVADGNGEFHGALNLPSVTLRSHITGLATDAFGRTSEFGAWQLINTNAPVANDDFAKTDGVAVVDVLANDGDIDGNLDPTSVTIAVPPRHGRVVVDAETGVVTYTPNHGFRGIETLVYQVTDLAGEVSQAVVTIDVDPVRSFAFDGTSAIQYQPIEVQRDAVASAAGSFATSIRSPQAASAWVAPWSASPLSIAPIRDSLAPVSSNLESHRLDADQTMNDELDERQAEEASATNDASRNEAVERGEPESVDDESRPANGEVNETSVPTPMLLSADPESLAAPQSLLSFTSLPIFNYEAPSYNSLSQMCQRDLNPVRAAGPKAGWLVRAASTTTR